MWIFNRSDSSSNPFRDPPFVEITQVSYLPRPLPWNPYPHFHTEECECAVIFSGAGFLNLPGCRQRLSAGTVFSIPPRVAHFYEPDENGVLEYLTVRFRIFENASPLERLMKEGEVRLGQSGASEAYRHMFRLMESLFRSSGGIIDGKLQTLCLLFLETLRQELFAGGEVIPTYTPEYANDILVYLQQNISRKVTLEELSERFSLSQSHLSRVFLKTYHISPINYLIYSRMRAARVLILRDDLPPAEIAKQLAYHNTWHFTKAFEQFFHCRPEEYRAYVRETET